MVLRLSSAQRDFIVRRSWSTTAVNGAQAAEGREWGPEALPPMAFFPLSLVAALHVRDGD